MATPAQAPVDATGAIGHSGCADSVSADPPASTVDAISAAQPPIMEAAAEAAPESIPGAHADAHSAPAPVRERAMSAQSAAKKRIRVIMATNLTERVVRWQPFEYEEFMKSQPLHAFGRIYAVSFKRLDSVPWYGCYTGLAEGAWSR